MKDYVENTLNYYDENIEEYYKMWNVDFVNEYNFDIPDIFLSYLNNDSYILDLGCGVGRDSKYFISKGYKVKSIDGSKEMCKAASDLLNIEVEQANFLDMDYINMFDGVFACASLLHLNNDDLIKCLHKIKKSLKDNGIFYASFKYGEEERFNDDRYFNDMTEDKFIDICSVVGDFEVLKVWKNKQYKKHRQFINFILRKK